MVAPGGEATINPVKREPADTPKDGARPRPAHRRAHAPRWALHRRLYEWVLSWANTAYGTPALLVHSFAESSFFPIPPDVLQIALTLGTRGRAFFYAAVSTVGSVAGGLAGYVIGWGLWQTVDEYFYRFVFSPEKFERVSDLYRDHGFWVVFIAAFTPIPYKVFTIAGGVCAVPLPMFVIASVVGRGGRFFLVGFLLWWYGERMRHFVEKYFNVLTLALVIVVGAAVATFKVL